MNGKLYNLVYGETDSKTAERRGEELKTIVGKAYHKFNMSPEKIKVYLDKNINENNLRMIIELFSMLDIMFALPSMKNVARCIITKDTIEKKAPPVYEKQKATG